MTHKVISWAQIALSAIFLTGYFAVLIMFILGYVTTPAGWKDALTVLLGVITTNVGNIIMFWFQRQRVTTPNR